MEQSQCPGCRERDARIAELEARVSELEGLFHDLTKRPTAPRPRDPMPKAPGKTPSGKKRGGQPGHPPPLRHQIAELPALAAEITEYQGHARTCPACGEVTRAPIPETIRAHSVGPRLTAALSYFAGCHGVS